MDYLKLFADQERQGFPDLAGSEGQGAIRVSERLLNTILAGQLSGSASIRELRVSPRAGNRLGVRIVLVKSFIPPISLDVLIDKPQNRPIFEDAYGMLRAGEPTEAVAEWLIKSVEDEELVRKVVILGFASELTAYRLIRQALD